MHFLRQDEARWSRMLFKPWAAVEVKIEKKTLVISCIVVAKDDVKWAELPERFTVINSEGEVVKPTPGRKFFVSVETFNPWHLLTELEP